MIKKVVLPVVLSFVLAQGCAVVESGSVGVKTSLGTVKNESLQPGIHVSVPLVDWVTVYSARTVSVPEEFGSLTSDGQSMKVTATALYSINQAKAPKIFSTIGNTDDAIKDKIVRPVLLGSVKDVVSKYTMFQIIENQGKISKEVTDAISERLKSSDFVTFESFVVTGFVLDPEVQQAIEGKQIASQRLAQKATEVQIAVKEAERLKAISGSITKETLMEAAIAKWDGHGIPPTVGGNVNLLVQPGK